MSPQKMTLSPRDLAQVVGVSESSLKRWADDGLLRISRTAGGHRRIELAEAAAYIRRSGLPLSDPSPLGLADLTQLADGVPAPKLDYLLVDAIRHADRSSACGLTLKLYLAGRSICEICDGPMKHALRFHDTGRPLAKDVQEVAICLAALEQLAHLLPEPQLHRSALLLSDASVLSAVSLSMMQTVLAAERWPILEAHPADLIRAAQQSRAQVAALPAELLHMLDIATLDGVAQTLRALGCTLVILGGPSERVAGVQTVESMSEFASFVRCVDAAADGVVH